MRIGKCPKCKKRDLVVFINSWSSITYGCIECGLKINKEDLKAIKEQYNSND